MLGHFVKFFDFHVIERLFQHRGVFVIEHFEFVIFFSRVHVQGGSLGLCRFSDDFFYFGVSLVLLLCKQSFGIIDDLLRSSWAEAGQSAQLLD